MIEEKFREVLNEFYTNPGMKTKMAIQQLLTICQEAIREAKIEENKYWKEEVTKFAFYSPEIFDKRIKELENT